LIGITKIS